MIKTSDRVECPECGFQDDSFPFPSICIPNKLCAAGLCGHGYWVAVPSDHTGYIVRETIARCMSDLEEYERQQNPLMEVTMNGDGTTSVEEAWEPKIGDRVRNKGNHTVYGVLDREDQGEMWINWGHYETLWSIQGIVDCMEPIPEDGTDQPSGPEMAGDGGVRVGGWLQFNKGYPREQVKRVIECCLGIPDPNIIRGQKLLTLEPEWLKSMSLDWTQYDLDSMVSRIGPTLNMRTHDYESSVIAKNIRRDGDSIVCDMHMSDDSGRGKWIGISFGRDYQEWIVSFSLSHTEDVCQHQIPPIPPKKTLLEEYL